MMAWPQWLLVSVSVFCSVGIVAQFFECRAKVKAAREELAWRRNLYRQSVEQLISRIYTLEGDAMRPFDEVLRGLPHNFYNRDEVQVHELQEVPFAAHRMAVSPMATVDFTSMVFKKGLLRYRGDGTILCWKRNGWMFIPEGPA